MYLTRNIDYEGTFTIKDNVSFDNGINGVVVHKTTNPAVTVFVDNNQVFNNGKTTKDPEGRQDAGGLAINSGSAVSKVHLINNIVTANASPDRTYQCFGTCTLLSDSTGNQACGGSPSSKLD